MIDPSELDTTKELFLFVCHKCMKPFKTKWNLHLHLRTHNERPHTCSQCSGAFAKIEDLRRHEVIHWGETPFKCEKCGAAFRLKDNLDIHIKNTHDELKESGRIRKPRMLFMRFVSKWGMKYLVDHPYSKYTKN